MARLANLDRNRPKEIDMRYRSTIGWFRKIAALLPVMISLASARCDGANILWNTVEILDFTHWEDGLYLVDAPLPFAPSVWLVSKDGKDAIVDAEGTLNIDEGGSYWVYSFYGDTLTSFDDYLQRDLLADAYYTNEDVTTPGKNFAGHEDREHNGHTYLAIIGYSNDQWDTHDHIDYYGWVEMDGMSVVSSALTSDGPLKVGTGEVIPEPSCGLLLFVGIAALSLRRKRVVEVSGVVH